jgi:hypothetical protein
MGLLLFWRFLTTLVVRVPPDAERVWTLAAEVRTLTLEAETRILTPAAEDRTWSIP